MASLCVHGNDVSTCEICWKENYPLSPTPNTVTDDVRRVVTLDEVKKRINVLINASFEVGMYDVQGLDVRLGRATKKAEQAETALLEAIEQYAQKD